MRILLIGFKSDNPTIIDNATSIITREIHELVATNVKSKSKSKAIFNKTTIITHLCDGPLNKPTIHEAQMQIGMNMPDAVLFITDDNNESNKAIIVQFTQNSSAQSAIFEGMKNALGASQIPVKVKREEKKFLQGADLGWIRLPSCIKGIGPPKGMTSMSIEFSTTIVLAALYGISGRKGSCRRFLRGDWYYQLMLRLRFSYNWKMIAAQSNTTNESSVSDEKTPQNESEHNPDDVLSKSAKDDVPAAEPSTVPQNENHIPIHDTVECSPESKVIEIKTYEVGFELGSIENLNDQKGFKNTQSMNGTNFENIESDTSETESTDRECDSSEDRSTAKDDTEYKFTEKEFTARTVTESEFTESEVTGKDFSETECEEMKSTEKKFVDEESKESHSGDATERDATDDTKAEATSCENHDEVQTSVKPAKPKAGITSSIIPKCEANVPEEVVLKNVTTESKQDGNVSYADPRLFLRSTEYEDVPCIDHGRGLSFALDAELRETSSIQDSNNAIEIGSSRAEDEITDSTEKIWEKQTSEDSSVVLTESETDSDDSAGKKTQAAKIAKKASIEHKGEISEMEGSGGDLSGSAAGEDIKDNQCISSAHPHLFLRKTEFEDKETSDRTQPGSSSRPIMFLRRTEFDDHLNEEHGQELCFAGVLLEETSLSEKDVNDSVCGLSSQPQLLLSRTKFDEVDCIEHGRGLSFAGTQLRETPVTEQNSDGSTCELSTQPQLMLRKADFVDENCKEHGKGLSFAGAQLRETPLNSCDPTFRSSSVLNDTEIETAPKIMTKEFTIHRSPSLVKTVDSANSNPSKLFTVPKATSSGLLKKATLNDDSCIEDGRVLSFVGAQLRETQLSEEDMNGVMSTTSFPPNLQLSNTEFHDKKRIELGRGLSFPGTHLRETPLQGQDCNENKCGSSTQLLLGLKSLRKVTANYSINDMITPKEDGNLIRLEMDNDHNNGLEPDMDDSTHARRASNFGIGKLKKVVPNQGKFKADIESEKTLGMDSLLGIKKSNKVTENHIKGKKNVHEPKANLACAATVMFASVKLKKVLKNAKEKKAAEMKKQQAIPSYNEKDKCSPGAKAKSVNAENLIFASVKLRKVLTNVRHKKVADMEEKKPISFQLKAISKDHLM